MEFKNTEVFNFEGAFRGMRNPLNSWAKSDSFFSIHCDHEDNPYADEVAKLWADKLLENTEFATEDDYDAEYWRIREERLDWLYSNGMQFMKADHHYTANYIGPNDMNLARRLIAAGTEHRKFLRQIMVSVDITAPLYWWKEFDTYKVGTTANSTSTMHKLASTPITLDCFETGDYDDSIEIPYFEADGNLLDMPIGAIISDFINDLEALRQKYNETKDKRYWKELIRWLPNGWLQTRTVTMNYENLHSMYAQRHTHKLIEWHSFCDWVKDLPYAAELIIS